MAYTINPQKLKKRPQKEERSEFRESFHGRVWQDTYAYERVRTASGQPQPIKKANRTGGLNTNSDREENLFDDKNGCTRRSG